MGFGTPEGVEAPVHAARAFLQAPTPANECRLFLKIDFRNALNTLYRDELLRCAKEKLPVYYPYIWQNYRDTSLLSFGDSVIYSKSGVQQGDPLGPALFSLATLPLASSLKSEFYVWYLDDGAFGRTPATVTEDLKTIQKRAKCTGSS